MNATAKEQFIIKQLAMKYDFDPIEAIKYVETLSFKEYQSTLKKYLKKADKLNKQDAKEAEKEDKLAAKEAEKAAKLAAKEAEKAAKLAAKEAEKAAKLAAKEAQKATKLAAKEAQKATKLASKKTEKEILHIKNNEEETHTVVQEDAHNENNEEKELDETARIKVILRITMLNEKTNLKKAFINLKDFVCENMLYASDSMLDSEITNSKTQELELVFKKQYLDDESTLNFNLKSVKETLSFCVDNVKECLKIKNNMEFCVVSVGVI